MTLNKDKFRDELLAAKKKNIKLKRKKKEIEDINKIFEEQLDKAGIGINVPSFAGVGGDAKGDAAKVKLKE